MSFIPHLAFRVIHKITEDGVYPPPGSLVDSISCYTMDVALCNRKVQLLQKQREIVAELGVSMNNARGKWLINAVDAATEAASMIMDESIDENGLRSPRDASIFGPDLGFRVENMTSRYGSFGGNRGASPSQRSGTRKHVVPETVEEEYIEAVASFAALPSDIGWSRSAGSDKGTRLVTSDHLVSCGTQVNSFIFARSRLIFDSEYRGICDLSGQASSPSQLTAG